MREGAPCACPQLPSSPPTAGAIPSTGPGAAEVARGRGCPDRARSSEPNPQSPEQRRRTRGVPLAPAGGSWAPGSDRLLMAAARVASSCDIHRWGGGEKTVFICCYGAVISLCVFRACRGETTAIFLSRCHEISPRRISGVKG